MALCGYHSWRVWPSWTIPAAASPHQKKARSSGLEALDVFMFAESVEYEVGLDSAEGGRGRMRAPGGGKVYREERLAYVRGGLSARGWSSSSVE